MTCREEEFIMINLALVSHSTFMYGAESSLVSIAALFQQKSNLSNSSLKHIHPILMIPPPENAEMATVAQRDGFDMVYTSPNPWYIYRSPNINYFGLYCDEIKRDVAAFMDLFKKNNIDIVIANTMTSFVPHIAAFLLQIPIITWVHGVIDPSMIPGIDNAYKSVIDKAVITLSNKIIFCSKWTQRQFENIVEKRHSVTLQNWAIEPSIHVPYDKSSNKFICLNMMEPRKGIDILVNAAKILKDKNYWFSVDLYGMGSEMPNIINQINTLGLNNYVFIKPRTTDVSKLYNECAAVMQPSIYESFGRTTIEAMSHKRPVIAAVTADPEKIVVDGKNGFHADAGNSEQLASKMAYILNNKQQAENIGRKGYKTYRSRFNGDLSRKKLTKLICEMHKRKSKATDEQCFAFDVLNLLHNII